MVTGKYFRGLLVALVCAASAFADAITPAALSAGGAATRDLQLGEISEVLRAGRGGYLDVGFYYTPFQDQIPLKSEYGEHQGFAFRHHLNAFGTGQIGNSLHLGLLMWFERSGWDGEDFFFMPQYNDFSLQRSTTTWGLVLTDTQKNLTFAAGMQHSNVEHVGKVYEDESDSLAYYWAHLRWGKLSAQGSFYKADWRSLRASLDLESRSIFGGRASGWQTYLPNVEVGLYNGDDDDSLRITWEQNLFAQRLYGEVSLDLPDGGFHSAALKYYPDPSRMIGFEATCLRRRERGGSDDLLWGGAVDLLFLRVAYNAAYDYEHFFGTKGTFLAEIKFSLSSLNGFLFGRGAPAAAPLETNVTTVKNKNLPPEKDHSIQLNNPTGNEGKVIEAKGIRYEKSGSAKGGK